MSCIYYATFSLCFLLSDPQLRRPRGINEVSEFLKTVFESRHPPAQSKLLSLFRPQNVDYSRCYRLFVKDELLNGRGSALPIDGNRVWGSHAGNTTRSTTNRTLSYWCLSPGR
ncbi:unnamed protein product [Dicrocoelium dendriticum]|nr:unnamed protein product [Dicrocoelium dendriticum]